MCGSSVDGGEDGGTSVGSAAAAAAASAVKDACAVGIVDDGTIVAAVVVAE